MKFHPLVPVVLAGLLALGAAAAPDARPTSQDEQQQLTPGQVLQDLMAGNERFATSKPAEKDWQAQVQASAAGQFPKAVILSCLDSRVPVEAVFDQGIGDVFVARVAGNIEGSQTLGSMEFATKVVGAKLVMVLGHEACGAVMGAIDGAELGHLTGLLDEIKPVVEATPCQCERKSSNREFVDAVVRNNVLQTVADIRKQSPILRDLERSGQIRIVGAYYDLHTGRVTLLQETGESAP